MKYLMRIPRWVWLLILMILGFGSGVGLSFTMQLNLQNHNIMTPVILLILTLAYTAYWHAARSQPDKYTEDKKKTNAEKAQAFARTCGIIIIALVVATLLKSFSSNNCCLKIAIAIDTGALVILSVMVFLYVIKRGVD